MCPKWGAQQQFVPAIINVSEHSNEWLAMLYFMYQSLFAHGICIWLIWENNRFSTKMKQRKAKCHWLFWSSSTEPGNLGNRGLLCRWYLKRRSLADWHDPFALFMKAWIWKTLPFFKTLRNALQPTPCCGTQADGLHGSSGTNAGSSESSCVLIIPCVPKAKVHLYRQCPLSGSGPSRQETLFFARQTYGLIPYGIFYIRMEGCALRITSRTGIFFIVCMAWHPWHEYIGEGDWVFSSLRLFLQLTSIR